MKMKKFCNSLTCTFVCQATQRLIACITILSYVKLHTPILHVFAVQAFGVKGRGKCRIYKKDVKRCSQCG